MTLSHKSTNKETYIKTNVQDFDVFLWKVSNIPKSKVHSSLKWFTVHYDLWLDVDKNIFTEELYIIFTMHHILGHFVMPIQLIDVIDTLKKRF